MPKNPIREATDDLLDQLNDEPDVYLPGAVVARVFTVAALSNWTPAVDDPFEAIQGNVSCNLRIIAEAYLVAMLNGWQPDVGDPVAAKLQELGMLTKGT